MKLKIMGKMLVVGSALLCVAGGCSLFGKKSAKKADAWTTQCKQWSRVLAAPRVSTNVDDVTQLLGVPPSECKDLTPDPMIGTQLDTKLNIIRVAPGSPAEKAGLRAGERILQVNKKTIKKEKELLEKVQAFKAGDQPLAIKTDKGTCMVVPIRPKEVRQCSWVVKPGSRYKKKKPFETTCRFYNNAEAQCRSRCPR